MSPAKRDDSSSPEASERPASHPMRLNRYLALCGVASRRSAMELVFSGRVQVNGEVARDPGETVVADRDCVELDGARVRPPARWLYYAFHKPRGVLVTVSDDHGRATIATYLRRLPAHVVAVGRLDRDSEGLLLLTNHGELVEALLHPRHAVERTYRVRVMPGPRPGQIAKLQEGVPIGFGEWSSAAVVRLKRGGGKLGLLTIQIREGKKREVRRMCRSVGLRVLRLRRIAFAGIRLGDLPSGSIRPLDQEEIEHLRDLTALDL
jgi:23S rRNA pseudouridine2605 synthase